MKPDSGESTRTKFIYDVPSGPYETPSGTYKGGKRTTPKTQKIKIPHAKDQDAPSGDSETRTTRLSATAPQIQRFANLIRDKISDGELEVGNVELAAILGYKPAQLALGRNASSGMSLDEFIRFLITDPNLKIKIDVG